MRIDEGLKILQPGVRKLQNFETVARGTADRLNDLLPMLTVTLTAELAVLDPLGRVVEHSEHLLTACRRCPHKGAVGFKADPGQPFQPPPRRRKTGLQRTALRTVQMDVKGPQRYPPPTRD